jgi:pimeloyl-ACP methyl ester carboxylesterase
MDRFRTADGLDIAYHEWGTPHRGATPPVVLQHGFSQSAHREFDDRGVVPALVAAGRYVVGIDSRGHGASSAPHDPACYGDANMASDLSALIDVIGEPAVHLVGYSMGTIVSLVAAGRDTRIERLVVGGLGARVVERNGMGAGLDAMADQLVTDDPDAIDDVGRGYRAYVESVGADRRALGAALRMLNTTPIDLAAVTMPTLVLVGRTDDMAERPHVLADALPNATLQLVDGDHATSIASAEFSAAIVEFLAPSR